MADAVTAAARLNAALMLSVVRIGLLRFLGRMRVRRRTEDVWFHEGPIHFPTGRPMRRHRPVGYENRPGGGTVRFVPTSKPNMTTRRPTDREPVRLLTPGEVANLFRVDAQTVKRWADTGRLSSIRTLGGHRRFREDQILAALAGDSTADY
jgi:excisionase family DNA binding protein